MQKNGRERVYGKGKGQIIAGLKDSYLGLPL
jgi:hypothetical protein